MRMPRERVPLFKIKVAYEGKDEVYDDPQSTAPIINPKNILVIFDDKDLIEPLKNSLRALSVESKSLKTLSPTITDLPSASLKDLL